MHQVARFFSYVFHPLWMPALVFFLALRTDPYLRAFFPKELSILFILMLGINIVAPGLSVLFMLRNKLISDIEITQRKERIVPFFIVLMYYLITYTMLRRAELPVPVSIYSMFLGVILTLLIAILVNSVWKISIHMMASGGMVGTFLGLFQIHSYGDPGMLIVLLAIATLLAFSRIYQGKHSVAQVYAGFLVGVLINYFALAGNWVI